MTIELSSELERLIRERVESGAYESPEQLVEQALHEYLADGDYDFDEVDVTEAIAQCDRGEAIPAETVFAEFRARHGISD